MCTDDTLEPLRFEKDEILDAQDSVKTWLVAQIIEVKDQSVLVHFLGTTCLVAFGCYCILMLLRFTRRLALKVGLLVRQKVAATRTAGKIQLQEAQVTPFL